MARKTAPVRTITSLAINDRFFDICAAVTYMHTLEQRRFVTLRMSVLIGLDAIIALSQFDRFILLKRWSHESLNGDLALHLAFDTDERRLLRETQTLLQSQSLERVSLTQTIMIAIYNLNRPLPRHE